MTQAQIGTYISKRRNFLDVTQQDLAELSGVGLRTIIQVERGTGNPSLSTIMQITKTLGLEIAVYCQPIQENHKTVL